MKTFELEDYLFHFVNQAGISIMCMTDKKFGQNGTNNNKKMSFAFLRDVQASLSELYTARDLQNAQESSLSTFSDTIREKLVIYQGLLIIVAVGILELQPSRLQR